MLRGVCACLGVVFSTLMTIGHRLRCAGVCVRCVDRKTDLWLTSSYACNVIACSIAHPGHALTMITVSAWTRMHRSAL